MCLLPWSICFWVEEWWRNGPGVMMEWWIYPTWWFGENLVFLKTIGWFPRGWPIFFKHQAPKIMAGKMIILILGWFLRPTWQCAASVIVHFHPGFHGLNFKRGNKIHKRYLLTWLISVQRWFGQYSSRLPMEGGGMTWPTISHLCPLQEVVVSF